MSTSSLRAAAIAAPLAASTTTCTQCETIKIQTENKSLQHLHPLGGEAAALGHLPVRHSDHPVHQLTQEGERQLTGLQVNLRLRILSPKY